MREAVAAKVTKNTNLRTKYGVLSDGVHGPEFCRKHASAKSKCIFGGPAGGSCTRKSAFAHAPIITIWLVETDVFSVGEEYSSKARRWANRCEKWLRMS